MARFLTSGRIIWKRLIWLLLQALSGVVLVRRMMLMQQRLSHEESFDKEIFDGRVAIGEGERDEAPMFTSEKSLKQW